MQALQNVTFSNFLHFSQFKITKQVKSLVKIKWLKKYTILRKFCFLKKCLPTCRIPEHFNVKTAVNFAVDFNKVPGNGDLWIPRKVYNVCMVSELAAENLAVITCSYRDLVAFLTRIWYQMMILPRGGEMYRNV